MKPAMARCPISRAVPEPGVWDRVCAEHGNCLGKKCNFYEHCFWQAAKRRMQGGTILVVNHALFFADLALRMAGVNYLPKYDAVILDEAHTIEDVAGQPFRAEHHRKRPSLSASHAVRSQARQRDAQYARHRRRRRHQRRC